MRPHELRFEEVVDIQPNGGCWLWRAALREGYGTLQDRELGRPRPAHRQFYEAFIGPIPDGLQLDHLCRVRRCVNPLHLEPVTGAVNVRRGRGTPLTPESAKAIREGSDPVQITADRFGVSIATVSKIRHGHRWREVA